MVIFSFSSLFSQKVLLCAGKLWWWCLLCRLEEETTYSCSDFWYTASSTLCPCPRSGFVEAFQESAFIRHWLLFWSYYFAFGLRQTGTAWCLIWRFFLMETKGSTTWASDLAFTLKCQITFFPSLWPSVIAPEYQTAYLTRWRKFVSVVVVEWNWYRIHQSLYLLCIKVGIWITNLLRPFYIF